MTAAHGSHPNEGEGRPEPEDVVTGIDPWATLVELEETVTRYFCRCTFNTYDEHKMAQHRLFAHPAHRNAALTCHAAPMWDHERWCLRPKDHDGDHWTPSFNGGKWWPRA